MFLWPYFRFRLARKHVVLDVLYVEEPNSAAHINSRSTNDCGR